MPKTVKAQTPVVLWDSDAPLHPDPSEVAGVAHVPAGNLLEPHPDLGKIVFHEDPSGPLDPEDWPEE